MINSFTS